ncbi:ABC transporter ATP-binding protein [Lysobacter sp. A286]
MTNTSSDRSPALQLNRLHFGYHPRQPVLHDINLQLPCGEFVALIGPNGSGKSTLLQCLVGGQAPTTGQVLVDGIDMALDPRRAKSQLGFAIDPTLLPTLLTGREALQLFSATRGLDGIPEASVLLADAFKLSPVLDRPIGQYSLGTRQKLGITLGLLGEPPLLVLDEPLNGLDPPSAWTLKQHLQTLTREHGTTVLLSTHSLDVAERFIDRAVLLVEGRLHCDWDRHALAAIRSDPAQSLEQAMVAALA